MARRGTTGLAPAARPERELGGGRPADGGGPGGRSTAVRSGSARATEAGGGRAEGASWVLPRDQGAEHLAESVRRGGRPHHRADPEALLEEQRVLAELAVRGDDQHRALRDGRGAAQPVDHLEAVDPGSASSVSSRSGTPEEGEHGHRLVPVRDRHRDEPLRRDERGVVRPAERVRLGYQGIPDGASSRPASRRRARSSKATFIGTRSRKLARYAGLSMRAARASTCATAAASVRRARLSSPAA